MMQSAVPPLRLGLGPRGGAQAPLAAAGGGEPLSSAVQGALEHSFGVDLQAARVHADTRAQNAARSLSARAFTFGNQIFLGPGERASDLGLIAHEAAHVVQQQGAPTLQRWAPGQSDACEREAQHASSAVMRREPFAVRERTGSLTVQRLGVSDALDFFAGKANLIPGFRMFTIILGVNPINMSRVERSAANILRALVEFMPGGGLITQALDNYGVFDKVGAWIEQQIQSLGLTAGAIKQAVTEFLKSLGLSDLFNLGGVWDRAKRIFTEPIDRIISFGKGLVTGIIKFIKDAILMPLAKLAQGTRGYDLLCAVLGKDPVSGEAVPQTADALIGGFMKFIGQEDVWTNMQNAKAVPRAFAWFKGAMAALMGMVQQVPTLFVNAFKALEIIDIVLVPRAFAKLVGVFGNFVVSFVTWAGNAVWNLLEIVFDVVSPGALGYIKKTGAALKSIFKNPLPFVGNLVKAAKLGFMNFADNFGAHLKKGLIEWLTGSLPGVYIPTAFSIGELVKFVFSVLGITWQNVRQKLVKATSETVVKAMETGFVIVVKLVTQGPAAAWEEIKDQLASLKDAVIGGITDFVVEKVVKTAVVKLISLFIPGAGFITAIVSIYDTVMVFVNRIKTIVAVITSFVDSIVAIAAGAIGAAAKRVESALAGVLSLAINFLAGFASLGKVSEKIMAIIQKVRATVDKALDKLVGLIVTAAKKLGRFIAQAGVPQDPNERLRLAGQAAITVARRLTGRVSRALLEPALVTIRTRYGLTDIRPYERGGTWWVRSSINPGIDTDTGAQAGPAKAEESGDVKDRARQALEEKIKAEPTIENIKTAAAQVQKDLQPQGLKQLIVKPPVEENVITIAAEASAWRELFKMAPKDKTLKLAVKIRLRGHVDGKPVPETHGLNVTFPDKKDPMTGQTTAGPVSHGTATMLPPVPGSNEVEIVAWNTGLERSAKDDVATHAERQLESFFESKIMGPGFVGRIEAIELRLKPFSPCNSCSGIVNKIGELLPESCRKEDRLLVYQTAYPGGPGGLNRTTETTLALLRTHWTVVGPPPAKGENYYKE